MNFKMASCFVAGVAMASVISAAMSAPGGNDGIRAPQAMSPQNEGDQAGKDGGAGGMDAGMAAAMEKAAKYTQPGPNHTYLERFLGKWDTEFRLFMGGQGTPPTQGHAEYKWLIDGRWIQSRYSGSMMGMPYEGSSITGYDNFKMSYVTTSVSSVDTAMNHSEGDLDPDGSTLLMYGTLDEYLTGEHDKMVKTVIRWSSKDKFVMEIHDLPIGEKNTKVVEITFNRAKS